MEVNRSIMLCKFITTTSDLDKCFQLRRSLILNDWNYHIIEHEWKGFGGKIIETYNYLKANPDITHFFYSDAWDTVVLGTMEEALSKLPSTDIILFSAERACYPHPGKAGKYPDHDSPWKYLNGGGWFASSDLFCQMVESNMPAVDINDQAWFTDRFLDGYITLDYNCTIFQTMAFCRETDFKYQTHRLYNRVHRTTSLFIHGNGHTPMPKVYDLLPSTLDSLKEVQSIWQDLPEVHKRINETFTEKVNANKKLKEYRDWIEGNVFGFGERSFLWMWKLLLQDMIFPDILEIGVFRGQILGLVRLLSPDARITGITPLNSTGGHWESDYGADIKLLHDTFKLKQPQIIKGLSDDLEVIAAAAMNERYDIIYIDGGHTYNIARSDIYTYSSFVRVGGYLVIDDSANKYNLPEGYFRGIEDVSRAVDELLPNEYYTEIFNVVHNRIFKRIK